MKFSRLVLVCMLVLAVCAISSTSNAAPEKASTVVSADVETGVVPASTPTVNSGVFKNNQGIDLNKDAVAPPVVTVSPVTGGLNPWILATSIIGGLVIGGGYGAVKTIRGLIKGRPAAKK